MRIMSTSSEHAPDDDDAIDTAAAAWLCEREEGFAPGRAAAFAAWRAADPRHAAAVARTAEALALLDELPAMRARLEEKLAAEPTTPPVANEISHPWWQRPASRWGGLAAALIVGGVLLTFAPGRAPVTERFATTAVVPREVALRDGSVININTDSDVSVRLTTGERRVTLARGEAHFAVAHDAARPFIVTAGGFAVRAVGTAFSVRVGVEGVEVLVTEGKVQVERVGPHAPSPAAVLSANERALIAPENSAPPAIERVAPLAIREALAWHARTTTFSDVPLRDVLARFNRRNATQLTLADDELGARKVGGTFALDQAEAFSRLLVADGDIAAERRGENEIVLRRAR